MNVVRVGKWMSRAECDAMMSEGRVLPTLTGVDAKPVTHPPNAALYTNTKPGDVFAEFDVPEASLAQGGKPGWRTICGRNSLAGRAAIRKGLPPPELPVARDIVITRTEKDTP